MSAVKWYIMVYILFWSGLMAVLSNRFSVYTVLNIYNFDCMMVDTFTRTRSTWTLHFTICLVTLVTENLESIPKIHFSFASSPWKAVKVSWVARMERNFDDYPGFHPMRSWANTYYAQDCKFYFVGPFRTMCLIILPLQCVFLILADR